MYPFNTELQKFQYMTKYARYSHVLGRRETWFETVWGRVVPFLKKLSENKLSDLEYKSLGGSIFNLMASPSMRLVAMAGTAAERDNFTIYNCAYIPIDNYLAFVDAFTLSMAGAGVGFSVESFHVGQLPIVQRQDRAQPVKLVISDSAEGWAYALRRGLDAWFGGWDIEFDYHLIRPAGSVLKVKGGQSSGPASLQQLLDFARLTVLNAQGRRLTTLECHDVMCEIAAVVVSGSMRRTAMLSLFDEDDIAMRDCKNDINYKTGEHVRRVYANNSVVWEGVKAKHEIDDYLAAMHDGRNGEPGIFSRYAAVQTLPEVRDPLVQYGTNPCQPGFATVLTRDGELTFDDIGVGSEIWSDDGWVNVVAKRGTGIKEVYKYVTCMGDFVGTSNHRVMARGEKIEVGQTDVIDACRGALAKGQTPLAGKIEKIEYLGEFPVYDITVDGKTHTYWSGGLSVLNCGEVVMRSHSTCNLSIAIARENDTLAMLAEKVRVAAILGTIQSMAAYFPNAISSEWKKNAVEERLLGVDILGQWDCAVARVPENLAYLKQLVIDTNIEYAEKLGIVPSVSATCVKPSGNSSLFFDATPGLNARYAPYYIRRVSVGHDTPVYRLMKACGVEFAIENGGNGNTSAVAFPVKSPTSAKVFQRERTALEQLNYWLMLKKEYTSHNPSVTITYRDEELPIISQWLMEHQDMIGGISFLPLSDIFYPLARYEAITEERYNEMMVAFPVIDWDRLSEYEQGDETTMAMELACSAGGCDI